MRSLLPFINAISLALVLVLNYWFEKLPLGGQTTGQIAAKYPVLIQPAAYAFGIWTVIYALLAGFVVYSFTKKGSRSRSVQACSLYFMLSCLFNVGWLAAFHLEKLKTSVIIMFSLLLTLIILYTRLRSFSNKPFTLADRIFVLLPFSFYLGWICVASIVNVAVALYAFHWDRFGISEEAWTIIMLMIAAWLAIWMSTRNNDWAIATVFIWAFIAIGVSNDSHLVIAYTAYILALLLFITTLYRVLLMKVKGPFS
ncbi:tryptophan-rich sensory protein [Paenibacillus sp. CF384]|uniref:tryptophan-rich sensory protein n=1 Tax=Paenibacillus sp. CF384 TaxID=1884382 RepID=UPI0008945DE8|nr:tryptophan-rich sensory protein [Paenibacillus sp. CF384]SDW76973.1 TspO and MBR related proteins [Paenibacillus sp. CF384]